MFAGHGARAVYAWCVCVCVHARARACACELGCVVCVCARARVCINMGIYANSCVPGKQMWHGLACAHCY